jgi:hypothetical protein
MEEEGILLESGRYASSGAEDLTIPRCLTSESGDQIP